MTSFILESLLSGIVQEIFGICEVPLSAEGAGFEPAAPVRVLRLSKPLHYLALPPFQVRTAGVEPASPRDVVYSHARPPCRKMRLKIRRPDSNRCVRALQARP